MSDIVKAIERTYKWVEDHENSPTYWAIDLHSTVLKPTYDNVKISTEYYPYAKEVLQLLSASEDDVLILFTSTTDDLVAQYEHLFARDKIFFSHLNENPDVESRGYADYNKKFYFNVMLEDKAGFDPDADWHKIYNYLRKVRKYE